MGLVAALVLIGSTAYRAADQTASPGATDLKALARQSLSKLDGDISIPGLREPVEVVRDKWGVPHIYARSVDDLFFAQGYTMGQDRLWQLEMWRRQREGRLSEILGPRAFDRDRQARLLMYRGAFDNIEWTSYHPEGKRIFTAYVNGLNAYIAQNANNLPVEFKLTGVKPDPWTLETVLLRSPNFGDASSEMQLARLVARVGPHEANRIRMPDPWDDLKVPEGLDVSLITDEAVAAMGGRGGGGGRGAVPKPEIVAPYKALFTAAAAGDLVEDVIQEPGSNNWAVAGSKTVTGKPIVSNDPHREVTNPSLRYIVHLNAPGWNVIGAQEAPFVGVALGHNERVAWGLTITGTDQNDVFVEEVNPANQNFDLPTVERSGGNGAVGADGASYREIMDTSNWDRSVVTNVPGQSGQPESPYYSNLLPLWDKGEYFPMVYSRVRVDQEAAHKLMLKPAAAVRPSAQR